MLRGFNGVQEFFNGNLTAIFAAWKARMRVAQNKDSLYNCYDTCYDIA